MGKSMEKEIGEREERTGKINLYVFARTEILTVRLLVAFKIQQTVAVPHACRTRWTSWNRRRLAVSDQHVPTRQYRTRRSLSTFRSVRSRISYKHQHSVTTAGSVVASVYLFVGWLR